MRIFILLALLLFSELVMAQTYLNIGVRGGGNSSSITFIPRIQDEIASISGYQIGGTIQYINLEHVGIQLDPMLINQGWRQISEETETTYKIDFLHLPLTTYAYVGRKRVRFFANVGIFANVRMEGRQTIKNIASEASQTYNYKYQNDRDNLIIYGLTGGGGISYDMGFGVIGADIRISNSFGNIMKPNVPTRDFSRDQVLSINGFYQFKLIEKKRDQL